MAPAPYGLTNSEGEHIFMLGSDIRVLAGGATGASFSLMDISLPPGEGPPPHIHDDEDEAFYVLEGRMRFRAGEDELVLESGGCVYLPRSIVHQPMAEGDQPARALVVLSRPGLETFFAEFVDELARSSSPPSVEMLDKVGLPYGLRHFPAIKP
jgi:quercetin dioxygenase-like cupin family protein